MTRDDLRKLARDAGFQTGLIDWETGDGCYPIAKPRGENCFLELEIFAARIADAATAAEREACAKVCEELIGIGTKTNGDDVAFEFAETIRARGRS